MRRVRQVCAGAVVLASLVCLDVPLAGAQGIVSGVVVPPIAAVAPGMPVNVSVAVPGLVSQPTMPVVGAGVAGTGSGSEEHVTHTVSRTSEPATIELGE